MTTAVAKFVSKRILKEHAGDFSEKANAKYDIVDAVDSHGNPTGKKVKRKKATPVGISPHDANVLAKVRRRAHRLDENMSFCGFKFGVSAVIALIPFIGDFLDIFMALMVFKTCQQVEGGLSSRVKSKMMFNIIVDFSVGLVPFLGDVADAFWKANTKNALLLERFLIEKAKNQHPGLQIQGIETYPIAEV